MSSIALPTSWLKFRERDRCSGHVPGWRNGTGQLPFWRLADGTTPCGVCRRQHAKKRAIDVRVKLAGDGHAAVVPLEPLGVEAELQVGMAVAAFPHLAAAPDELV